MSSSPPGRTSRHWTSYYRQGAKRPPRELLLRTLEHIEWERGTKGAPGAIEIGCGGGNESLEMLRRGWRVLAIDKEAAAAQFLTRRTPARWRSRLTTLVSPMEELHLPPADLVFASFSLPFCDPDRFPGLWAEIRAAVRPRGHFAGVLFGDQDEWADHDEMTFHSRRQLAGLTRGWKVEMLRETVEEGRRFKAPRGWLPKHWHYFDLILERRRRG